MPPKAAEKTEDDNEVIDPKTGEITTTKSNAIALEDEYTALAADSGAGFENQTSEDVSVPFLYILQPGSKEVLAEGSAAKAGMVINKSTGDLIQGSAGITFIPAVTQHLLVEWIPRDNGGGFVGQYEIDSEMARRVRETQPMGTYKHPGNGNDLVETFYIYGVALDAEGVGYPAVIAFSSTHIKAYKDWMFRARSIVIALPDGRKLTKVPLFSHGYQIRSQRVDKAGNTWYIPVVSFADTNAEKSRLLPSSDLYQAAKAVQMAVGSGALRAATETLDRETAVDETPQRGPKEARDAPY